MDFFDSANEMEKYLRQKCADKYMPFSGGLELTPECNMDCKFCYVHQNRNNRLEQGNLLTGEQWCKIIDQAFDMGVYSFLITGGEPLLHPQFKQIFSHASQKGMPIVLNTNGTLINEDYIEFFKQNGCRRFNISLYGSNNETYEKLCGYRGGFDRVMNTLHLMKKNGMTVRISVSLTPQNIGQIDEIHHIAKELGFPVQFATYMFPGTRRGVDAYNQYRLTPKEAAAASNKCFHLKNPNVDFEASCRYSLSKLIEPAKYNNERPGFLCYAGKSDFWISWNGEMRPCGIFRHNSLNYSLLNNSFEDCWNRMTVDCRNSNSVCSECRDCNKRDLCMICPAASYAETGRMDERPEYLCELTDGLVQICKQAIADATFPNPLVSIIIPVYNSEEYLKDCIESILRQKLQNFELILVDDGSTDGSGRMCDQFAANDRRIRVIHQPNKGVSAARNAGIREAKCKYLLFCDSDDYAETDFAIELYHKALELGKDHDINTNFIMSNVWVGNSMKPRKVTIHTNFEDVKNIPFQMIKASVLYAYVWNKIYDRDLLLKEHILFDESMNYGEDYKFNEEYMTHCTDAAYIPAPLMIHLTRKGGLAEQGLVKKGIKFEDIDISGEVIVMHK